MGPDLPAPSAKGDNSMKLRRVVGALSALTLMMTFLVATALPSTATGGPAVRSATPACGTDDLAAGFGHVQGAAGSTYGRLRLTNVSGHPCVTGGYGGVSYVGYGNGTQIGASADRTPGHVRSHTLAPGQRLISVVRMVEAGNYSRHRCRPAAVDGFRVYVPNATRSTYVAYPQTGCRNNEVHLLSHTPYRRP